jgi:UDP-sugar pyrophosphorylase
MGKKLPLCIMTSGDTNARTVDLLKTNDYFGMEPAQITLVQQGQGVPALLDNDARIAVEPDNPCKVQTKPHGHGDIHSLLYKEGVAKKWREQSIEWLVCFQDTNGLSFHTLPLMLGVSASMNNLVMNSLAVPRKAKQAIGGIAQLTKKHTGEVR